ncbi:hypothetical protein, partial [uncultured Duncaniella sp.]|uniref:hypothetical protein n=1 Tax=uncultured Duncaniella sp. TaxID=2768039 RepID=UPI0026F4003E
PLPEPRGPESPGLFFYVPPRAAVVRTLPRPHSISLLTLSLPLGAIVSLSWDALSLSRMSAARGSAPVERGYVSDEPSDCYL